MKFDTSDTALVVIDPQNDALSETGAAWGLVGASVQENNTVENLARLFAAAKSRGYGVFISPHYMYPHDTARSSTVRSRAARSTGSTVRARRHRRRYGGVRA